MVTVNGQPQNAAGKPLAQLLEELGYQAGRIAVERNGEIVPKAQYGAVTLEDGDTLEVVGPDTKPFSLTVPPMADLDGNVLLEPKTPQSRFTMQLPRPVPPMSFLRHAVELSARD